MSVSVAIALVLCGLKWCSYPGNLDVCECGHSLGTLWTVHVVKLETWVSGSVPIALVLCGL